MKKFVIIDHSLSDLQGHHYECSISVAEAAARAGYLPIILANRSFPPSLQPEEIQIIPAFEVDWFNQPVFSQSQKFAIPSSNFWQNLEARNDFFSVGKKRENTKGFQLHALRLTSPRWSKLIEKIEGSLERLGQGFQQDLKLLSHIPFANTLWRSLKIGGGVLVLAWEPISKIVNQFLSDFEEKERPGCSFTETLARVLPNLTLTAQDHIFIHTLGIEQLEELYHWLANGDRASMPTYHLLLRRDTEDPLVLNAPGMGLKSCLQACYDSQLWPAKMRFYTDTQDLVNRHNRLSSVQFGQIPIPFRQEKLAVAISPWMNPVIHIVYLGDARSEKGYHHLPNLVAELWTDYIQPRKVKFTIQSNYNVQGGEPQILEAKFSLAQYPDSKVRLMDTPMSPDEYYQLLISADIVVLPYNPQAYQRTSGVLTEALAAGKPVVVPEGSWLAQQVDESRASIYRDPQQLAQSVIRLIDHLSSFTEAAQKFSVYWREQQSPDRLIQCLLNPPHFEIDGSRQSAASLAPPRESPKILILMAGESLIAATQKSSEPGSPLSYFCQCGYQVYGVFYGQNRDLEREDWKQFSQAVQKAAQGYDLKGVWILEPQYNQGKPPDCSLEQYQRYIEDSYYERPTVFKRWIEAHYLGIPAALAQILPTLRIDCIYLDSILYWPCLKNLRLDSSKVMGEVSQLYAYQSALLNRKAVDAQELAWEVHLLQQCPVLLTPQNSFAEKVQELTQNPLVYALEPFHATAESKASRRASYHQALNQACLDILGAQALPLKHFKPSPKIAILYPWGNIQERQSGASQRTGLLWDYLTEQSYEVRFFTLGKERSRWQEGVCYEYHDPLFSQGDLIKKAYGDAYRSWYSLFNEPDPESPAAPGAAMKQWLPWIYYQFRFDPNFQSWLENIIDWADVVILEYPFWAESVSKICQRKQVRWILTAHDVLAKNLPPNTPLFQIALREELQALRQADAVVTLSLEDQAFFSSYGISSHCIPIGIDIQTIQHSPCGEVISRPNDVLEWQRDGKRPFCLFVGSNHQPNLDAVKQIQSWSQGQTLTFDWVVVGSCCKPQSSENFLALGTVSDRLLVYLYQQATLVLAPLTAGTGMSVKIIEAMAYGKMVLGTAIAFRGYPVRSGINCLVYDSLEHYPEKIEQLLQQPDVLVQMGQEAKEFAKGYDYRQLYKTYLDLMV